MALIIATPMESGSVPIKKRKLILIIGQESLHKYLPFRLMQALFMLQIHSMGMGRSAWSNHIEYI